MPDEALNELTELRARLATLDPESPEHRSTLDRISVLVREQAERTKPPNESKDWTQAHRETYARLRQKADADTPEAWLPTEVGDVLFGVLVDVTVAAPTKFGPAPVCKVQTPEGPRSLWLLHAVLRREFERAQPAVGETILVRYLGKVTPEGGGNAYESYSLTLDREAQPFSWDQIADRYGDAQELRAEVAETLSTPDPDVCHACGFAGGKHADGCPEDIPF